MSTVVEKFERMLARGKDSALLRYSLGTEYLKIDDDTRALEHLAQAVVLDREYSAAWKLYAKVLVKVERAAEAMEAYRTGIEVAKAKGDLQSAKEMGVFLRRLEKNATP
ncbi:MAG: hypothetical protein K0U93_26170 [Gammaproteobacteria bacterium]|nr:hypothetical protein [Gammaproteobacteria bacterium]